MKMESFEGGAIFLYSLGAIEFALEFQEEEEGGGGEGATFLGGHRVCLGVSRR